VLRVGSFLPGGFVMTDLNQSKVANRLLRAMSEVSFERLRPHLIGVDLVLKELVVPADEDTTHVHFIECRIGSVITSADGEYDQREQIEVGHIGWEGMTGAHIILGSLQTPNRTMVQAVGSSLRLETGPFSRILDEDPLLLRFLLRYVHSCQMQVAQSALANGRYNIRERLARWILMCHDRTAGDDLELTHEFLALMLGVRRAGVTDDIHVLEGEHLIRAKRGRVHVLDREGLEALAGGCYGRPEREYERLMGHTGRSRARLHIVEQVVN
jgi:hypothetical protein